MIIHFTIFDLLRRNIYASTTNNIINPDMMAPGAWMGYRVKFGRFKSNGLNLPLIAIHWDPLL